MAIYSVFSHNKWWFAIAMLNYQRVNPDEFKWAIFPMQRSISLDQSFKVQEVTLQLRSVRGGISLADLVCLGSCCWPFGNQTWLGTSSFISDVPLISGGKLFFFCHQKKDSLTAVPHLGRTREIVMDSPDPGRSIWDADWHVERSVIDVVIFLIGKKSRSPFLFFIWYLISVDICENLVVFDLSVKTPAFFQPCSGFLGQFTGIPLPRA